MILPYLLAWIGYVVLFTLLSGIYTAVRYYITLTKTTINEPPVL